MTPARSVAWPNGTGGRGSSGVSAVVSETAGAIGYADVAYALKNHFKYFAIQNRSGRWNGKRSGVHRSAQNQPSAPATPQSVTSADKVPMSVIQPVLSRTKEPEIFERNVHRQLADRNARIVAEPDSPGYFLKIRAKGRLRLFKRRLEGGQQTGPGSKRSDEQIDRRRKLDFNGLRPLLGDVVFGQIRDHPNQHSRGNGDLDGQAGGKPQHCGRDAAQRRWSEPVARRKRPNASQQELFSTLDFGRCPEQLRQPLDRQPPRALLMP